VSGGEDIEESGYYYATVGEVSVKCYDAPSDAKKTGDKAYIWPAGQSDI
jgi:hypothetical protein